MSPEEALKSIETTNSLRPFQVIGSNAVTGECNDHNKIKNPNLAGRHTGDQINKEVTKSAPKIAHIRLFSSAVPKFIFTNP